MAWGRMERMTAVVLVGELFSLSIWAEMSQPRSDVFRTPALILDHGPALRDPNTGQTWTPDTSDSARRPEESDSRASGPDAGSVTASPPMEVVPQISVLSMVPITAGPAVPLIEIDHPSVGVLAADRWYVVLYLQNNSDIDLTAGIACTLLNDAKVVAVASLYVPFVGSGERVGIFFEGPWRVMLVDGITCRVSST